MAPLQTTNISSAFIWRRVHSLMGFWLVLYIIEHLIVNSQAALWIGDDGIGFIRFVNFLESLPFLQIIESLLIGIPLLVHAIWGIQRALSSKFNFFGNNNASPHLPYSRNRAFTWQRLSSWVLLIGIFCHVVQMRFLNYPQKIEINNETRYVNQITFDEGLITLAPRLHVTLRPINNNEVIAESPNPGTSMLLMVRDTFKNPWISILYTIFVLAAAFHACNGFWTFLITWGVILSYRSQNALLPLVPIGIMILSFLGLAAIWGTYWINLYD